MLGHQVASVLSENLSSTHDLQFFARKPLEIIGFQNTINSFDYRGLESLAELNIREGDLVINCIGIIKSRINELSATSRLEAVSVNAELPLALANLCEEQNAMVIQIATDCVFSGITGNYNEKSPHDGNDTYGKTKSLGEANSPNALNIRCSIVGRELTGRTSLLEWFLSKPLDSVVSGYVDHFWNGVTTLAFAKLTLGLIKRGAIPSGTVHWVPKDSISKHDLLGLFRSQYDRSDINLRKVDSGLPVNRVLQTLKPSLNEELWSLAGYQSVPSIEQIIGELE